MIYTPMVKKAMKIAYDAHEGQEDKSGVPYIFHPIHLAEQMEDEVCICAALLHDVIEDSEMTAQDLQNQGISEKVIEVVTLLTKQKEEEYLVYLERIKANETAKKIKLADLRHNSDLTRLEEVKEKDRKRAEKYQKAIKYLSD